MGHLIRMALFPTEVRPCSISDWQLLGCLAILRAKTTNPKYYVQCYVIKIDFLASSPL